MELKGVRPGRFTPRCSGCGEKFSLLIPTNPKVSPTVSKAIDEVIDTISSFGAPLSAPAVTAELPQVELAPSEPGSAVATMAPPIPPRSIAPPPTASPPVGLTAPPLDVPASPGNAVTTAPEPSLPDDPLLSGRIGGYELISSLGRGGMGAVYLARQVSLDRHVALKVLSPSLAGDPQFVARFTREAYAAAQLTHHNIVQIHDIGAERDIHYFSMEYVEGRTLSTSVREHGKLDPEAAAGYILQAARGLKFAHDHGMVHRDVKPENLLLNDQGILKVADLGLVKRANVKDATISNAPRANGGLHTQFNVSMGTPAYMPPEQARDAAHVDQRADIYSLGCTLYDLLTGRPPFMGRTAMEVITKHQREPITPPDLIVRDVPRTLSTILLRMVAKRPEDRYQSMQEVIAALEDFLGVSTAGPFTPRPEHAHALENAVRKFNTSGWHVLRWQLIIAFFAACGIGILALALTGHALWAATVLGIAILTAAAYQITIGITQKAHLFIKFRQLILGSSLTDWLMWLALAVVLGSVLIAFGWLGPWMGAAAVSVLLAVGFHFSADLMRSREREPQLVLIENMLKQMRLRGLDETSLRQFICRYSGNDWEEFYETLFGYEAKLRARELWGSAGERNRNRRKFAAWRDPIIRWIDRRHAARREAKQRKLIQSVEARALAAGGMDESEAQELARESAIRVMDSAAKLRDVAAQRAARTAAPVSSPPINAPVPIQHTFVTIIAPEWAQRRSEPDSLTEEDAAGDSHESRQHMSWFRRRFGTPIDWVLGSGLRFVAAMLILLCFAIWWQQNKGSKALDRAQAVVSTRRELEITSSDMTKLSGQIKVVGQDFARGAEEAIRGTGSKALDLPFVSPLVCKALSGWNAAIAGIILLLSVFCTGRLMAITVLLAAAVALVGHWFNIPGYGFPAAWITAVAAGIMGFVALIFFRTIAE
jgi:hypothetical protein